MARNLFLALFCVYTSVANAFYHEQEQHYGNRRLTALIRGLKHGDSFDRMKNGDLSKLSTRLAHRVVVHQLQAEVSNSTGSNSTLQPGGSLKDDILIALKKILDIVVYEVLPIVVDLLIEIIGALLDGLWPALESMGIQVINCVKHVCSANVTIDQLMDLVQSDVVKFVYPIEAIANSNTVGGSEGDIAMYSNIANATYNVTGSGVKVGVISQSYNCRRGASKDIAAGAIPADVAVLNDLSFPTECAQYAATDEGRAMIQIVHNVAPGAEIAFRTGARGSSDLIAAMMDLVAAKCDVIVNDMTYFNQPFFQDGLLAQYADMIVTRFGVPYFTAAGNLRGHAWDATAGFLDSGLTTADGSIIHQFGSDINGLPVIYQNVTFPNVNEISGLYFQWDEPFWSVTGNVGSASDLDIFLMYDDELIFSSVINNIDKDPYEAIAVNPAVVQASGESVTFMMVITLKAGPPPTYMRVVAPQATFELGKSASPVIFGDANAPNVAAVGATYAEQTSDDGSVSPQQRNYSSPGGTPIYFDADGDRLDEPEVRQQPRISGSDGVSTTFFGTEQNGTWRFLGTSASAPHVAAVAALMLELSMTMTPQQVYSSLEESAVNIGQKGFDFLSGYGLVDAQGALAAVASSSSYESQNVSSRNVSERMYV